MNHCRAGHLVDDGESHCRYSHPLAVAPVEAQSAPADPWQSLKAAAAQLHAAGHDFRVEDGRVITGEVPLPRVVNLDLGREHFKLGLVSDPHLGSRYEQLSAFRDFYHRATEEGVDAFLNMGDISDGSEKMHPGRLYELHTQGVDGHLSYAAAVYPRSSAPTYFINGNHDESWTKDAGINFGRRLSSIRPDLTYIGSTAAYLTIGSFKAFLSHPSGGKPYADSYRLQKVAEALPVGRPVNALLVGHLHIHVYDKIRGIHAMQVPCFQRQYPYLAAKGLYPTIGGVILDVTMTEDGSVSRLRHELITYPTVEEDDFDAEVAREIARGWTAEGLVVGAA